MNKHQIFNIIAWILIILGVILLVWRVFGNSSGTDLVVITLLGGLLFKVMLIGEDLSKLKIGFKFLGRDFKDLSQNFK